MPYHASMDSRSLFLIVFFLDEHGSYLFVYGRLCCLAKSQVEQQQDALAARQAEQQSALALVKVDIVLKEEKQGKNDIVHN